MHIRHNVHIAAGKRTLVDTGCEFPGQRITLLLGESGIGKSLMAKAVYGLLDPGELTVTIDGKPYNEYLGKKETLALQRAGFFVFQEPSTHLNPLMTLKDQLREGSLGQGGDEQNILDVLWKNAPAGDIQRILDVFPKPHRPSGGEKQRLLLAMAFKKIDMLGEKPAVGHELFVFDEPTGNLDNVYRDLFLDMLISRFRRRPFTALLITHDYSMIGKLAESYPDVMEKIAFKELHLQNGKQIAADFDPKLYLNWLDEQSPHAAQPAQSPLLEVSSGAEVFGRRLSIAKSPAFDAEVPLVLRSGQIAYLKAASGTGKTTIVKLTMGLLKAGKLRAQLGTMHVDEKTPRSFWHRNIWGKRMTMVFQHADEALNPESTVEGVFHGLPTLRIATTATVRSVLLELFDEVDEAFLRRKVKHLSGGQKQRLNLMRGFALDTDMLILDEPLNGLDFESADKVISLLRRKQQAGKGILLISHNEEIFDRIVPAGNIFYLRASSL